MGISAVEGAIAGGIGAWLKGVQFLKGASFGVKFGLTLARGEIAALSSEGIEYAVRACQKISVTTLSNHDIIFS